MLGRRFARPVLVVDDDEATRSAERAVLTEDGFRVIEARDGAEAMRQIQADPPALIVLDIQMPGIDGPAFALALRKGLRHVPLVILTGVDDQSTRPIGATPRRSSASRSKRGAREVVRRFAT